MKNIEQFLLLGLYNKIISVEENMKLLNLFNSTYPNSDLFKNYLTGTIIDKVFTFSEAGTLYNLSNSTLNKNIEYNNYFDNEIKQSGRTWLITLNAMERLYPHRRLPVNAISYLTNSKEIISISETQVNELINLLKLEYPNMDIHEEKTINKFIKSNKEDNCLEKVVTFSEAAKMYNLSKGTLRKNVNYGRYENGEVRQSEKVWLITLKALKRLYGKGEEN